MPALGVELFLNEFEMFLFSLPSGVTSKLDVLDYEKIMVLVSLRGEPAICPSGKPFTSSLGIRALFDENFFEFECTP